MYLFFNWRIIALQTMFFLGHQIAQFSLSVMSDSLNPHGQQHPRLPCPSPAPEACSNSCPLAQWYHPTISSSLMTICDLYSTLLPRLCWCSSSWSSHWVIRAWLRAEWNHCISAESCWVMCPVLLFNSNIILKPGCMMTPTLDFLHMIYLNIWSLPWYHMKFRIYFLFKKIPVLFW